MKLLDVVAILGNLPESNLYHGQAGTIVEVYEPGIFEVEFSDNNSPVYAIETLKEKQLMLLYHKPIFKKISVTM